MLWTKHWRTQWRKGLGLDRLFFWRVFAFIFAKMYPKIEFQLFSLNFCPEKIEFWRKKLSFGPKKLSSFAKLPSTFEKAGNKWKKRVPDICLIVLVAENREKFSYWIIFGSVSAKNWVSGKKLSFLAVQFRPKRAKIKPAYIDYSTLHRHTQLSNKSGGKCHQATEVAENFQ